MNFKKMFVLFLGTVLILSACSGSKENGSDTAQQFYKEIISFSFENTPTTIAGVNISVTLPFGTNLTSLTPTIVHTGKSIAPASGVTQNFSTPVSYTVTAEDGTTKVYIVTVNVASNSAKDITGFSFPGIGSGVSGIITEPGIISVPVPYGTNVTSLTPTIIFTGTSVSPTSGAPTDFTTAKTYTVTAANGSTKTYTVTVTPALNSANNIIDFNFIGIANGIINEADKTITINLPNDIWDVRSLVPTVTIDGESVIPASLTPVDFTNPVHYIVTAANGIEKDYLVTVNVHNYALRDTGPSGGLIFYINPNCLVDGWKYLEAAQYDLGSTQQWSNVTNVPVGGTFTEIGKGNTNTIAIYSQQNHANSPARLCAGTPGWFLPSKDELNKMYTELKANVPSVGNFYSNNYWSSSENNALSSYYQSFLTGQQNFSNKTMAYRYRCIRAF